MSLDLQIQQLDELMDSMPALAAPSRPRSQRKHIVTTLYARIQAFLKKNYNYEKICELIESVTGIVFKVTTLRKYLYLEKVRLAGGKLLRGGRTRAAGRRKGRTAPKSSSRTSASEALDSQRLEPEQPSPVAQQPLAQESATQPKASPKAAPVQAWVEQQPAEQPTSAPAVPADLTQAESQDLEASEDSEELEDWGDDDSEAGGLLNEPRFNTIRRNYSTS